MTGLPLRRTRSANSKRTPKDAWTLAVAIPDDVGGLHGLVLRSGDEPVAKVYFVVETSIVGISPRSGPAGTPVTIHLKGVGWTEYDNIYVATYDNAYMGYACGFNSRGDVVINFTATGEPGTHLIDLYPGIYQGPPTEPQQLYRLPQLTYADDHPGNRIPALRFAFEVTPTRSGRAPTSHLATSAGPGRSPGPLDTAGQREHKQDDQQKTQRAARSVAPASAVRPCGYGAKQHQHENHHKYRDHNQLLRCGEEARWRPSRTLVEILREVRTGVPQLLPRG